MDEKVVLKVLREQQIELQNYHVDKLCGRYEEKLFEFESNLAQVVTGVRRSGKSTLCHKVLNEKNIKYGYVNFDDDRLYSLTINDLDMLLGGIYQIYGVNIKYLFFDEIQDVEGWYLFVNRLLRQGMRVFLTGSNAKLLSGELATHLTGRYNEIKLYPFSFSEMCFFKHIDTEDITTKAEAERKVMMSDYLADGGMPELQNITNQQLKRVYVDGLIETIISKDISKRHKIRNVEGLRLIAQHLINNMCQVIDYEVLANIAKLKSAKTAQQYVSYLQQAFLIHRLQKFSYKSHERLTAEKAYVVDTGFVANRDNFMLGENVGWRLENMVLIEILRRHHSEADDVYYYKPSSRGKEIDFVVSRQGIVIELVQVAYSIYDVKTFKRETSALIEASEKLRTENLTLVCLDESRNVEIDGHQIKIYSATDWFLNR